MSGRAHKKKRKADTRAARLAPAPAPSLPADFPPWLHYQVGPQTQQADAAIAAVTQQLQRTLAAKSVLQTKQALEEHVLPLLGSLMQLVVYQGSDIVSWAQRAMYELYHAANEAAEAEPVVGIPADHADELCAELEKVMEWLEKLSNSDPGDFNAELIAEADRHGEALAEVAEAIDDYALEEVAEDEDEDEDEEDEDEEGDEDEPESAEPADEPPLHILDPDAAPLVR